MPAEPYRAPFPAHLQTRAAPPPAGRRGAATAQARRCRRRAAAAARIAAARPTCLRGRQGQGAVFERGWLCCIQLPRSTREGALVAGRRACTGAPPAASHKPPALHRTVYRMAMPWPSGMAARVCPCVLRTEGLQASKERCARRAAPSAGAGAPCRGRARCPGHEAQGKLACIRAHICANTQSPPGLMPRRKGRRQVLASTATRGGEVGVTRPDGSRRCSSSRRSVNMADAPARVAGARAGNRVVERVAGSW